MDDPLFNSETIRDCFQWDVINWKTSMKLWNDITVSTKSLDCLEIGSRDGGLSLYLALHGHRVISSDLEKPGHTASALHQQYGVKSQITYESIDALNIPYTGKFDFVIFKSVLGGIGRDGHTEKQEQALQQMFNALKPGGYLLFAENVSASFVHRFFRRNFNRWGSSWNYPSCKRMKQLLTQYGEVTMSTTGFAGAFGRTEGQRRFLGFLDKIFFNLVTLSSWQYIAFGYVRKKI